MALTILTALIGYTTAVKVLAILKMLKIDTTGLTKSDFEELLEDPRIKKYMR